MVAVTKLIDILNKPALVKWANKIGLEGLTLSEYRGRVKSEGTNRHKQIEDYINHGYVFDGCEILEESLSKYEVLGVETKVQNEYLIGRIDLLLKKENDIYVLDFKRGKNVYLNTKLQLSTYAKMYGANKVAFINSDTLQIKVLNIDIDRYYMIVKRLYQINELIISLNEEL